MIGQTSSNGHIRTYVDILNQPSQEGCVSMSRKLVILKVS